MDIEHEGEAARPNAPLKRPLPEVLRPRHSFAGGLTMYSGVVLAQLRVSLLAES